MDTEAFDFVLGTNFFVEHSQILSLTLQAPYVLQVLGGSSCRVRICPKLPLCGTLKK